MKNTILIIIMGIFLLLGNLAFAETSCIDQGHLIRCTWDDHSWKQCLNSCPDKSKIEIAVTERKLSCAYVCDATGHHEDQCDYYCSR